MNAEIVTFAQKLSSKLAAARAVLTVSVMESHPWRLADAGGTMLTIADDGTARLTYGVAGRAVFTSRQEAEVVAAQWNAGLLSESMRVAPMTVRQVAEAQIRNYEEMIAHLCEVHPDLRAELA